MVRLRVSRSVKLKCLLLTIILIVLGQPCLWVLTNIQDTPPSLEVQVADEVSLLILIHATAKPSGKERRDTIRRTWTSTAVVEDIKNTFGKKIAHKFVLGTKGVTIDAKLTTECKQHKDMILLDQVTDEHATLTQRTLNGFVYIINNAYKFSHVLKCDDDSVVDLKKVVIHLNNISWTDRLYWGDFVGAYSVLQDGMYAEHSWYLCDKYFPYAFGGGYVVSRDLIELIVQNSPFLVLYNNEDVSLASWLSPYNFIRVHDQRFDTGSDSENCRKSFIVVHKISLKDMVLYYRSLLKEGRLCGHQTEFYGGWTSHKYNWRNPPSQCCEADDYDDRSDKNDVHDELLIF